MRISCDLDGTIFKTYERLAKAFQIHFKTTKSLASLVRGEGLSAEEKDWIYKDYFYNDLAYIGLPTYQDAVPVLRRLAKKHEIYFVSGRPLHILHLTGYELAKLKLPIDNLFLIPRDQKAEFIKDLAPDWIIEDEYPIALELALKDFKVILLERDWNIDLLTYSPQPENLKSVKCWLEVKEILTKGGE